MKQTHHNVGCEKTHASCVTITFFLSSFQNMQVFEFLTKTMPVSVAIALCCLAVSSGYQINMVDMNVSTPTQQYPHSVVLEKNRYYLYWDFNETHVIFEVIVK